MADHRRNKANENTYLVDLTNVDPGEVMSNRQRATDDGGGSPLE